jgi:hypothetical protein
MTECLVCGLIYLYQETCPNCRVRKALELDLSTAQANVDLGPYGRKKELVA